MQVAWFGMARPKKHQRKTSHHGTLSRKRKAPAQQGGSKKKQRKAEVASKASESDSDYVSDTDEGSPAYTTARKVDETDDELEIPKGEMVAVSKKEGLPKSLFPEKEIECTTRAAVQSIVSCLLWPRGKFVDSNKDLRFMMQEKTICRFMIYQSNLPELTSKPEFWDRGRKWVKGKIAQLRSDKSVKMRFAFFGKYMRLFLFIVCHC